MKPTSSLHDYLRLISGPTSVGGSKNKVWVIWRQEGGGKSATISRL